MIFSLPPLNESALWLVLRTPLLTCLLVCMFSFLVGAVLLLYFVSLWCVLSFLCSYSPSCVCVCVRTLVISCVCACVCFFCRSFFGLCLFCGHMPGCSRSGSHPPSQLAGRRKHTTTRAGLPAGQREVSASRSGRPGEWLPDLGFLLADGLLLAEQARTRRPSCQVTRK
jgi:hypothetical protein